MVQVFLIGFVCFLTPGMFNAISNLGAGGVQDVALVDITNSLLYAMFCIVGFFSGSIHVSRDLRPPAATPHQFLR